VSPAFSVKISTSVVCACSLDDPGIRGPEAWDIPDDGFVLLKSGARLRGTLTQLERWASLMERHDGFDLHPTTIAAANRAAKRICAFTAKLRQQGIQP
jgi:hypothetical protein